MFHQQLAGDEVEEEALEELELELEEAADAEIEPRPCSTFIAEKLAAQGVTLEDLVKCLLIEHEEYEPESEVNDRYSDQMFGKFRQIISNYPRQQAAAVAAAQQAVQMPGRTEGQRHQSSRLRAEVEINIGCLQNRYRILEDDDDDDDDV
jgi:primosomal protein N''